MQGPERGLRIGVGQISHALLFNEIASLPEMDLCSVACAIQNLWLAARAEGIGMGWGSMFDPEAVAEMLNTPPGSKPVAILCLGHVKAFYPAPMLELQGWTRKRALDDLVFHNSWGQRASPP